MKALLLTNEYPPNVYGGAGVHVEFLTRELARLMDVEVRCFVCPTDVSLRNEEKATKRRKQKPAR